MFIEPIQKHRTVAETRSFLYTTEDRTHGTAVVTMLQDSRGDKNGSSRRRSVIICPIAIAYSYGTCLLYTSDAADE